MRFFVGIDRVRPVLLVGSNERKIRLLPAFASLVLCGASVCGQAQSSLQPGFAPPVSYVTGASVRGSLIPVTADFDGDGVADIAVSNLADASISVLFGVGDGSFQAPVNYTVGYGPYGLAAGDFNGDGKPDLAVVNGGDGTVSILLNQGGGRFPAAPSQTYSVGTLPFGVSVGDFNKDGALDLVVTNNADRTVSVLMGKGDGTFGPASTYATGDYPMGTAVGDLNGDGYSDLVVWNVRANNIGVLLNDTHGGFLPQVIYATQVDPYSVAIGDFNGDGANDLAVANLGSNTVSVLLNNKSGVFLPQVTYSASFEPSCVLAHDMNGDGIADLVILNTGNSAAGVLLGKGDGTFLLPPMPDAYQTSSQPYAGVIGDFNGDGRPDLATTSFVTKYVAVELQTSFGPPTKLAFLTQPASAQVLQSLGTVTVAIEDAAGHVVTNISATKNVTLTLQSNPAGAAFASQLTSASVFNGVVTFSGLSVTQAGTGDTILATASSLVSATSNPFNVTAAAGVTVVKPCGADVPEPVRSRRRPTSVPAVSHALSPGCRLPL